MRLLTISFSIAATLCVLAHAEQVPESQSSFTASLQRDEVEDTISELEYRALILDALEGFEKQTTSIENEMEADADTALADNPFLATVETPPIDCSKAKSDVDLGENLLSDAFGDALKNLPFVGNLIDFIKTKLKSLTDKTSGYPDGVRPSEVTAITVAFDAIEAALYPHKDQPAIKKLLDTLAQLKAALTALASCPITIPIIPIPSIAIPSIPVPIPTPSIEIPVIPFPPKTRPVFGRSKMSLEEAHCSSLADFYRQVTASSIDQFPVLADSATDEVKRLSTGSISVLSLMSKSSIASSNEGLLATRPIFAGRLLEQYRDELLHQDSISDDFRMFVRGQLGIIVSLSNALEACLHIAADPVHAADGLEDELEYDDYEDEDFEDEDFEEDEQ
ncbi:hypothetical protein BGZ83_006747 [Gryganskiella cystojenkinii]|nr:hypothetical protein BGZ83_006747 [Gryganskiella cystojenkinii]